MGPVGLPAPSDVAAPPADAMKTASGLASKVLTPGTGTDHPSQNDTVKVNYTGWTTDGKMFDSSVPPLQPGRKRGAHHAVARPCHPRLDRGHAAHGRGREAPLLDPRGARVQGPARRARRGCSSSTSSCSTSPRGPSRRPTSPAAPAATRRRPRTVSRARSRRRASGTVHPKPNDGVRVNYSIWQHDGKLLDASRDKPAVRPVTGLLRRAGPRVCSSWSPVRSARSGCPRRSDRRAVPG